MEKMQKKNNNKNLDIDNVEKILIKSLENKKERKNNSKNNFEFTNEKPLILEDFSKEIIDFNKSFPQDNPILSHFDRKFEKENIEQITAFNSNKSGQHKHNLKFFNPKIGEYNYTYFDATKSNKTNNVNKIESSKKNLIS